jgi:hypothetical protein
MPPHNLCPLYSVTLAGYAGLGLGVWYGKHSFSFDVAMDIVIVCCLVSIPFGWWSLSPSPGFCIPEHIPPQQTATAAATTATPATALPPKWGSLVGGCGRCMWVMVLELFGALRRSRSFRFTWLWSLAMNSDASGFFLMCTCLA